MNIECLNHEPADVEIKQVDSKNVHKKIYFLSLMDSDFINLCLQWCQTHMILTHAALEKLWGQKSTYKFEHHNGFDRDLVMMDLLLWQNIYSPRDKSC